MQEAKSQGKIAQVFATALEASGVEQGDATAALSELLASKDAAEIQKAKKAAFLAASVMQKHAVPKLESAQLPVVQDSGFAVTLKCFSGPVYPAAWLQGTEHGCCLRGWQGG
jgi:hypothetical protein